MPWTSYLVAYYSGETPGSTGYPETKGHPQAANIGSFQNDPSEQILSSPADPSKWVVFGFPLCLTKWRHPQCRRGPWTPGPWALLTCARGGYRVSLAWHGLQLSSNLTPCLAQAGVPIRRDFCGTEIRFGKPRKTPPRSPSTSLLPFLFWGRVPLLKSTTEKRVPLFQALHWGT